jgi:hypothetical protein
METVAGLKQMEGTLSITNDKLSAMKAKLEDLLFRAQRIAAAQKNNMANNDTMFGYDIQRYRREVRTFGTEISGIPVVLGAIERTAERSAAGMKFATNVMRLSMKLSQTMRALHDMSLLAHQHIRSADMKIEAWYLAQDIEEMVMRAQGMPTVANKIVMAVAVPDAPAPPPAGAPPAGAPPAAAPPGGTPPKA